jgi:hypothetical protein
MAQEPDDSVSYLVALKQASGGAAPAAAREPVSQLASPNAAPSGVSPVSQHYGGAEKRRSPRYRCEGSAEMRQEGIDLRTWATFTDISLQGCYVEATATYPVGTLLQLKLEAHGLKIYAKGSVRLSYAYTGMGIAFTEVSEEDLSRLRELLQLISRPSVLKQSGLLPPVTNAQAALKAIVEYFGERQILTREEFSRLLRKSQAS